LLAVPRTDPYVKNYLIRLLSQVGRDSGRQGRDVGLEDAAGTRARCDAFATRAMPIGLADCDDAFDGASIWLPRPRIVQDASSYQEPHNSPTSHGLPDLTIGQPRLAKESKGTKESKGRGVIYNKIG